ncbi:DUF4157 domain-containing protein [Streptomyces sp. NPDC002463]|uniref:eCIS core domain-containing protein n=1 Tax=Streptomyces sp. NPDC002463 TaxID=3364645 RepID=UPI00367CEA0F
MVQMLRQAGYPWAQPDLHQHGPACGHQAATSSPAPEGPTVQRSAVHDVLRSPGQPMDDATRTDMEERLGADFSDVRIHNDAAARASAAEIGARAYTSGSHVVIGVGGEDKHTLAHELTHVIQQRQGPVAGTDNGSGLRVSDPSDRYEREAEANAARALSGQAPVTEADHEATRTRSGGEAEVQRAIVQDYDSNRTDPESVMFWNYARTVDDAVQWAYNFVVSAPSLGAYAALAATNGHIAHWLQTWNTQMTAGVPGGVSRSFGYIIETLAGLRLDGVPNGGAPAGFVSQTQAAIGATRPDYLLVRQSDMGYVGAVDITARNSAGHIHNKIGWLQLFPRFCESVYPSLDAATEAQMRVNYQAGNQGPMTPQQVAAAQAQANANVQEQNRILANMNNHFKESMDSINIMTGGRLARGGDPLIVEGSRREAVQIWMQREFGFVDNNIAASLLQKLGHSPVGFGFGTYTASDSTANAFLHAHGPRWQQGKDLAASGQS